MAASPHRQASVFGEIVDWLLAPLLILWPISMAIQYFLAYTIANDAYDRELRDSVVAVARQLSYADGRVAINTAAAAVEPAADALDALAGPQKARQFRERTSAYVARFLRLNAALRPSSSRGR